MKIAGNSAGNFNLKGKKEKHLSCGCCVLANRKDKKLATITHKETKKYLFDGPVLDSTDN